MALAEGFHVSSLRFKDGFEGFQVIGDKLDDGGLAVVADGEYGVSQKGRAFGGDFGGIRGE
jgi:hypothetical protein